MLSDMSYQRIQSAHLAFVLLLCAMSTGCQEGIQRVPVSGVVLIDGSPLPAGVIRVYPEGLRPASGNLDGQGRFVLGTYENNDGTLIGTHPVSIDGGEWIGPGKKKWHAPPEYNTPDSGLTIKVDGPTENAKIELTWNGGKPYVKSFRGSEQ